MLPRQLERLQKLLRRWGHTRRAVEQMKPWSLLNHYYVEKKKREALEETIDPSLESGVLYSRTKGDSRY